MAEEKKNAQVINGVNDDIAELKSSPNRPTVFGWQMAIPA